MPHRRVVAATDTANAIEVLRHGDRNRVASAVASERRRTGWPSCFLAAARTTPAWPRRSTTGSTSSTKSWTTASDRLRERHGLDLAPLLRADTSSDALRKTTASLPAVFLTSVALARQWMAWGVTPSAFVGHSLGEYTAAHLAGVLTLDGALDLIVARADAHRHRQRRRSRNARGTAAGRGGATAAGAFPVGGNDQRRRRVRHRRSSRGHRDLGQASLDRRDPAHPAPDRCRRPQLLARSDPARLPRARPAHRAARRLRSRTSPTSPARGSRQSRRPIRSTGSTICDERFASPTACVRRLRTARWSCWRWVPVTRCRHTRGAKR